MSGPGKRKPAAPAQQSKADLIRENERLKVLLVLDQRHRLGALVASVLRTVAKVAGWVFGAWLVVREIAGRETNFNANVRAELPDLVAALTPPWWLFIVLVLVALTAAQVALGYRRLHIKNVKRIAKLTERYELLLDPGRTTSGLGSSGSTNEDDVL